MSLQESPLAERFNQFTSKWNEKCNVRLRELWPQPGMNLEQVAAILSVEFGGRSGAHAVAYRAHRLQLPVRQAPTQWSPEIEARFKELHATGKAFSEISRSLNEEFPGLRTTRNGCIGKARRLGLEQRQAKPSRGEATRRPGNPGIGILRSISQRVSKSTRALPKQSIAQVPFLAIEFMQLESSQCRYPRGGENGEPILF